MDKTPIHIGQRTTEQFVIQILAATERQAWITTAWSYESKEEAEAFAASTLSVLASRRLWRVVKVTTVQTAEVV